MGTHLLSRHVILISSYHLLQLPKAWALLVFATLWLGQPESPHAGSALCLTFLCFSRVSYPLVTQAPFTQISASSPQGPCHMERVRKMRNMETRWKWVCRSASPFLGSELLSCLRTIWGPAACPTLRKTRKCGGSGFEAMGMPWVSSTEQLRAT